MPPAPTLHRQISSQFSGWGEASSGVESLSILRVFLEKLDRIADGQDCLGGVIGDFAAELLLESHHELDGVETVGAKIIDTTRLFGHLSGLTPPGPPPL